MKSLIFLFLSSSLFAQQVDWLKYDQKTFDSDTCCWRKLSNEKEHGKAAKLIVDYIKNGQVSNKQSLNWHAGQMFAFAGENKQALKYFGKTYSVFQKWFGGDDGKTWFFFAKGTSAFIKRDKQKLVKIIEHWKVKFTIDNNLKELERLITNWNLDYKNATVANTR